jgi:hypothetical protein
MRAIEFEPPAVRIPVVSHTPSASEKSASFAAGFSAPVHPLVHPFQPIHVSPEAGLLEAAEEGRSRTDIVQGVDISRVFEITSERPRTLEIAELAEPESAAGYSEAI